MNPVGITLSILSFFGIYMILAISLNLEYGFAGQPNFGKVLFYSVGAYMAGILAARVSLWLVGQPVGNIFTVEALQTRVEVAMKYPLQTALTFILVLVVSAVVAGVLGYLTSYPALRIREEWYLAMVLLVSGEIIRIIIRSYEPIIGGYHGLAGITDPFTWVKNTTLSDVLYTAVILVIAFLSYSFAQKLVNSPYGRLLKALRDDETAAQSLGKDVARIRSQILIIGSALAGIAGVLYAYLTGYVTPDDFIPIITLDVWTMMVLGGKANNKGVLLGAMIITLIDRGTTVFALKFQSFATTLELNYVRYIIVGVLMTLIIMYRQQGLIPEEPIKTIAYEEVKGARDT